MAEAVPANQETAVEAVEAMPEEGVTAEWAAEAAAAAATKVNYVKHNLSFVVVVLIILFFSFLYETSLNYLESIVDCIIYII